MHHYRNPETLTIIAPADQPPGALLAWRYDPTAYGEERRRTRDRQARENAIDATTRLVLLLGAAPTLAALAGAIWHDGEPPYIGFAAAALFLYVFAILAFTLDAYLKPLPPSPYPVVYALVPDGAGRDPMLHLTLVAGTPQPHHAQPGPLGHLRSINEIPIIPPDPSPGTPQAIWAYIDAGKTHPAVSVQIAGWQEGSLELPIRQRHPLAALRDALEDLKQRS